MMSTSSTSSPSSRAAATLRQTAAGFHGAERLDRNAKPSRQTGPRRVKGQHACPKPVVALLDQPVLERHRVIIGVIPGPAKVDNLFVFYVRMSVEVGTSGLLVSQWGWALRDA